jgi:hypothetical protein
MYRIRISNSLLFLIFTSFGLVACTTPGTSMGAGATDNPLYNSDLNAVLENRDGDGVPDLTETIAGSDVNDASDTPKSRIDKVVEEYINRKTPRTPTQGVCLSN